MARPKKDINWDLVLKKMEAGCTAKEIFSEGETKMNHDTFYSNFKDEFGCSFQDYYIESDNKGKGELKLMQHVKAMSGNITMLMYLGRVRLGQREAELTTNLATNQEQLDQSHLIMELQNIIAKLKENDDKPKTE